MTPTLMIMAGGTGGHVFSYGRASRLTLASPTLASTENMFRMSGGVVL